MPRQRQTLAPMKPELRKREQPPLMLPRNHPRRLPALQRKGQRPLRMLLELRNLRWLPEPQNHRQQARQSLERMRQRMTPQMQAPTTPLQGSGFRV